MAGITIKPGDIDAGTIATAVSTVSSLLSIVVLYRRYVAGDAR